MKAHLYTVIKCMSCAAHKKEVIAVAEKFNIDLRIIDVDDERYLYAALRAMQKYGVDKTPSIVLLRDDGTVAATIQGIRGTIEKLEKKLNEERNSNE